MDAVAPSASLDNAVARKMNEYYTADTGTRVTASNAFIKRNFPEEEDGIIPGGRVWGGLTMDQKVAFGLYMTSLGVLTWGGW